MMLPLLVSTGCASPEPAAVVPACGFAGLLGPAALIAAWDKIADAALSVFKGRNGGGGA